MRIPLCFVACLLVPVFVSEAGQTPSRPAAPAAGSVTADAPPPPVPPATISRDASRKATVRAVRVATPLGIDGKLDEAVFNEVPPMSGFIQNDPQEGAPASEDTHVWVLFDDNNLYIVARCWESRVDTMVANEMRRDNTAIAFNDQFAWGLDTFHDRRNMVIFEVNAAGGRVDAQITNERQIAIEWNPIWDVKTRRFEGGFIVEAAIPFKSLRYGPGKEQVWGIQFRRHRTATNEYSYLTPIPASVTSMGHFRAGLAATLVGVEVPTGTKNLDIKPFATANLTTDRAARPIIDNDAGGDIGVDVKYGVTQSLAADFTVNTDFAQVEADEQQINLTRFNLFFPEKREFFLENAGVFGFGVTTPFVTSAGDTPLLFYSRTIGLYEGREVPIRAGARLSGRIGQFTIGALNVQSGDETVSRARATNFTVVRVKRDVLRRSSIGVIATNRSVGTVGPGANQAYGIDGAFLFGPDLVVNSYWAQSRTDGIGGGGNTSYRALVDYNADQYGVQLDHLLVGRGFDPQIGFVRRRDLAKNYGLLRFSPRPKNNTRIRKYIFQVTFNHIENATTGRLESRAADARFAIDLQNSDVFAVTYTNSHETLPAPFRIAPGVTLPVDGYDFGTGKISYNLGRQRRLSGNLSFEKGTFYNGNITTWTGTSARVNATPQWSFEPGISINQVDIPAGRFTTTLVTTRTTYTMTPLMFTSALLQYNSGSNTFAMNVRFRWEYSPGSEFFLVYNDQRDTLAPAFPDLVNRAVVIKINRVIRF